MLKKYRNAGKQLNAGELMKIKGGVGQESESSRPPQCFSASDCGHIECGGPDFTAWYCINRRCLLLYC